MRKITMVFLVTVVIMIIVLYLIFIGEIEKKKFIRMVEEIRSCM